MPWPIDIFQLTATVIVISLLAEMRCCTCFKYQFNRPFGHFPNVVRRDLPVRSEYASMLRRSNETEARDNQRIDSLFRVLQTVGVSSKNTESGYENLVPMSEILYEDIPMPYESIKLIVQNFPVQENMFLKLENLTL